MRKLALPLAIAAIVCFAIAIDSGLAADPQASSQGVVVTSPPSPARATLISYQEQNMTIGRYCFRCHNDTNMIGGMSLEAFDAERERDVLADDR